MDAFLSALKRESQPTILTKSQIPGDSKAGASHEIRPIQLIDPSQVAPEPPRKPEKSRTRSIPAAVATSNGGFQTTGPLAEKLPQKRRGGINLWAVPGSTIRVYNTHALDADGQPKLIAEATAPDTSSRERNWSVSYPAQRKYQERMGKLYGAQEDGLVMVALELPVEADWDARDQLSVTQQVGERAESQPTFTKFTYYTADNEHVHDTYVVCDRLQATLGCTVGKAVVKPGVRSTEDYAVTPHSRIQMVKDGFPVGDTIHADRTGQFSIDFPGNPSDGVWELQVGTKRIPITGTSEDKATKIRRIERTLREALTRAPEGGRLSFSIPNVPDGFTLEVKNPGAWEKPQTFRTDDATNVLDVCIRDVVAGDVLALDSPQEAAPGYRIDRNFRIPNEGEQARFDQIFCALEGRPEKELRLAMELMGPFAADDGLQGIAGDKAIQRVIEGAKAGIVMKRTGAQGKIRPLLEKGDANFLAGYDAGVAYRGAERFSAEEGGLKLTRRGESRIAVRGGYNMLKGTGTPLHPERVTSPSSYKLDVPGRDPITFKAGGGSYPF